MPPVQELLSYADEQLPSDLLSPGPAALINGEGYLAAIEFSCAVFEANPCPATAIALTKAIIHANFDFAAPDAKFVLSSSWGKDSTAMVGALVDVMLERQSDGRGLAPVIIAVADTGGEFPAMVYRVREQNEKIVAFGKRSGLDIDAFVASPEPKNHLLAELIGAGRPLPKFARNAVQATSASWCVQRLKTGPMLKALEIANGRASRYLHFLGVRSDESSRRASSIREYSTGMPFGLTTLSDEIHTKGVTEHRLAANRIGVQPIVHWDHETLTQFLRVHMAAWDVMSYESLKAIYAAGSSPEEKNGAGECRISLTKDGGVSNACSDLSGSRFGCLLCVACSNKSLQNHARNDPRYRWLRGVHSFIYAGNEQHRRRIADRDAHGMNNENCFPKGYLFAWRYTLLMLVYRAEAESGFTLLPPEVEAAIAAWWERSGVFTVVPSDARRDAAQWKATGKMTRSYESAEANYESLSVSLAEGIPGGVYAHLRHPDLFKASPLSLPNLFPFAGRGTSFYPSLKAYLFRDLSQRGGLLTLLTDVPSDMGRRLNTASLSGFEGFALEQIGVRELTAWERQLLRGRMVFYRHTPALFVHRIETRIARKWVPGDPLRKLSASAQDLNDILLANMNLNEVCGEKEFIDHLDEIHFIGALKGRLTAEEFKVIYDLVTDLAHLSDMLSDRHLAVRDQILRNFRARASALATNRFGGEKSSRSLIQQLVHDQWDMKESLGLFLDYVALMRRLNLLIRYGRANTELANRLAYIARTSLYDDQHAAELIGDLLLRLGLPRAAIKAA